MLLWKVAEALAERGIPTAQERSYLKIDFEDMVQVTIEPRPLYCDRGNFIVKVFPQGRYAVHVDGADAFPRYYFGVAACANEVEAWLRARKVLG